MKSVAFSGWTGEDQLQIWSSHSLILHIQIITSSFIIYQSIMEMLTYFHRMSLNKNCGCMIFSVAHRYRKSMSIMERVIYIYIYYHIFAIPLMFIEIYRVGDNRRPVNSSTSLHISDKLGTENVWETLLCWFIVVLWVLVCKNMYRYECHFGSSHRYSSLRPLTAHVSDCAIELTEAGSRGGTKTS